MNVEENNRRYCGGNYIRSIKIKNGLIPILHFTTMKKMRTKL